MSRRTAAKLSWSLCAVCVVLIGLAILLDFLTSEAPLLPDAPDLRPGPIIAVLTGVLALAYPTIGALIASRLPTNPVGWIFCGMGLFYTAQRFASAYADYALLKNDAFPGGEYAAWLSSCAWFACLTLGVFLILLFPDGRPPSRRWSIVAWAAILGTALVTIGFAFMPETLILTHPFVENPFGVVRVIGGRFTTYQLLGASRFIGWTLLLAGTLAALFSSILRLRRARGQERQQLKWFLFAAVALAAFLALVELELLISNLTHDFWYHAIDILPRQVLTPVLFVLVLALLTVPCFTYIAILKHRLYEIDIIINRSIVYGALTVLDTFAEALIPVGILDRFKVDGVIARWWNETQYDLKTLATVGFEGLVQGWTATIRAGLDETENKTSGDRFDPLSHKLIPRLLPEYLRELEEASAKLAEAQGRLDDATRQDDEEDGGDDETPENLLGEADLKVLKKEVTVAKKNLKALRSGFLERLEEATAALSEADCRNLALRIAREDLEAQLERYVAAHRREIVATVESWWDRYRVAMREIEDERDSTSESLAQFMKDLAYAG